ncbi:non-heme iron oxygenase ferredoxin subunit [Pusillimonas sp. CC-YST705]|uniref:Non-heme iron oxygenase ferredoxin subunit n=1 Tax=Mesopusillimonas faecipullorum TaxID=2755040 RepID=A0ABS8CDS8_9BURK|nr:non-heme iron oxygenase ferredoxin subunit [Mesopusillimonas faecipullorum]MCB5364182.1 non-heme iron oxygenase ferredoxin subunit [Mesopusillimonas faecipullorum]
MAEWIDILALDEVPEDDVTGVQASGRDLAVYGVEGEVYVTDNICTHGNARLCDGFLEDHEIECPLHQGRFDVRSGKALCAPLTQDIRAYPVKIEDGKVWIEVD